MSILANLRRIIVIPGSTIFNCCRYSLIYRIAFPGSATIHVYVSSKFGIALPLSPITHEQVYSAIIARCYAPASAINIVADPVGISSIQANVNRALRAHAADSIEVAINLRTIITGSNSLACSSVFIFNNIDVNNAIVRRYKFAISTYCTVRCIITKAYARIYTGSTHDDSAAADFNRRSNGAQTFCHTNAVSRICLNINHAIDLEPGTLACRTIHGFDNSTIRTVRRFATQGQNLAFRIIAAIMNEQLTTAINKQRSHLRACCAFSIHAHRSGIVDFYLTIRTNRCYTSGALICYQIDIQLFAI